MEIIAAAGQDSKLTRSLKAVQEEYQRFSAMKMRSFTSNASGDMANPGTEVTINCVIVFVSDNIPIYRFMQSTLSGSISGSWLQPPSEDLHRALCLQNLLLYKKVAHKSKPRTKLHRIFLRQKKYQVRYPSYLNIN
jgi:hypothetical protein